jgi:hypothetical protein
MSAAKTSALAQRVAAELDRWTMHAHSAQERRAEAARIVEQALRPLADTLRACADAMEAHGYVPPCLTDARRVLAEVEGGAR